MSSESNGGKLDSSDPDPASGPGERSGVPPGSAWGAARDALAAVHNLVALLRNAGVPESTLLDVLPELRSSAKVLHSAFAAADDGDAAVAGVAECGVRHSEELDVLLDAIGQGQPDRAGLATGVASLADELEALTDLLAMLDRAASPLSTEVSLDRVAREAGRMSGSARGRQSTGLFDRGPSECVVTADPYLLGPLLSLVLACLPEARGPAPVLRARAPPQAPLVLQAS